MVNIWQVSWYHSGRDITNNPRYSVTYASGRCSIEIGNAESGDAGKYTCRAVNTLGEAECSCNVVVEGKCKPMYCMAYKSPFNM